MIHALAFHGLTAEGYHHHGVDDARNMVRLMPYMNWALEKELLMCDMAADDRDLVAIVKDRDAEPSIRIDLNEL